MRLLPCWLRLTPSRSIATTNTNLIPQIKDTLKYLTNNNKKNNITHDEHVNNILKLYNNNLINNNNNKIVNDYYSNLLNNLRDIVSNSLHDINNNRDIVNLIHNNDWKLITKLVLSKNFTNKDLLLYLLQNKNNNLNSIQLAHLSLLTYYKFPKLNFINNNNNKFINIWIDNFNNYSNSFKRLFWFCIYKKNTNCINDLSHLYDNNMKNFIILYQSLFNISNILPLPNPNTTNNNLHLFFINSLHHIPDNKNTYKLKLKIVKLSIKEKIINNNNQFFHQYTFINLLSDILLNYNISINFNNKILKNLYSDISNYEIKLKKKLSKKFMIN